MKQVDLIYGVDVLEGLKRLPDESVDLCVTSPPYFGLRDYGCAGELGREKTPEAYVEKLVAVFDEVRRVLKKSGSCYVNLGDTYGGSGCGYGDYGVNKRKTLNRDIYGTAPKPQSRKGKWNKCLLMVPYKFALAMIERGWTLRNQIVWFKPNAMCSSVKDRYTVDFEPVFFFTKSKRYYFDMEAVREPFADGSIARRFRGSSSQAKFAFGAPGSTAQTLSKPRPNRTALLRANESENLKGHSGYYDENGKLLVNPNGRSKRCVWRIPTSSYRTAQGKHFAMFPEKLVEPMILASTSEKGNCEKCGSPVVRIVKPSEQYAKKLGKSWHDHGADAACGNNQGVTHLKIHSEYETVGWKATCGCNAGTVQPVVLDPFAGSGTTLAAAVKLGRRAVGIDLSKDYEEIARERLGLFVNA